MIIFLFLIVRLKSQFNEDWRHSSSKITHLFIFHSRDKTKRTRNACEFLFYRLRWFYRTTIWISSNLSKSTVIYMCPSSLPHSFPTISFRSRVKCYQRWLICLVPRAFTFLSLAYHWSDYEWMIICNETNSFVWLVIISIRSRRQKKLNKGCLPRFLKKKNGKRIFFLIRP